MLAVRQSGDLHRRHPAAADPVRRRADRVFPVPRRQLTGIKDTLINFGYPLIERFPLMFFTSAAVLLIGMARWYYGMSSRGGAARSTTKDAGEKTSGSRVSSVTSKVSSLLDR